MKVLKEVDMPLFKRKRITGLIESKVTPKKEEVAKEVAKVAKSDEKAVKVKHVYSHFGSNTHKIVAHAYKSEADMIKYEPKKKAKKVEE